MFGTIINTTADTKNGVGGVVSLFLLLSREFQL
jgi:hypothetical protein